MWSCMSIVVELYWTENEIDPSMTGKMTLYVKTNGAKALEVSLAELSGVSGVRGVTCMFRDGVRYVVFAHPPLVWCKS